MMRLRFGVEDLARTAFTPPGPYCELAVSAQLLQQSASPLRPLWLARRSRLAPSARQLLDIVPAHGSVPEFLCPEATSSLDEALDRVRSTPAARIQAELGELPWPSPPSPWVRDLARGRVDALAELGVAMHAYYDDVMAPLWPGIERAVSAELHHRAWQVASQGIAATLNTLHPRMLAEHTTSGLAHALGISTASASMHAAALRGAGLVSTRRDRPRGAARPDPARPTAAHHS
jgi:DNA-binding transcriptional ArsR family regulator